MHHKTTKLLDRVELIEHNSEGLFQYNKHSLKRTEAIWKKRPIRTRSTFGYCQGQASPDMADPVFYVPLPLQNTAFAEKKVKQHEPNVVKHSRTVCSSWPHALNPWPFGLQSEVMWGQGHKSAYQAKLLAHLLRERNVKTVTEELSAAIAKLA